MSTLTLNDFQSPEMAPVAGIGGLLSVKRLAPFYAPLLAGPSDSSLSANERFFPAPGGGLAPMDEMYGMLEQQLVETHERLEGKRAVWFGHSLGGLLVTRLGVEHPDKVTGVVCLAGVQEGITTETPATVMLRWSLGNPSAAEHLWSDSDFMVGHKKKLREKWHPNTSLHLISPTADYLIPSPQGLGLELPDGQEPEKRVVTPSFMRPLLRVPDDTETLHSRLPVGHVTIARSAAVIRYVRQVRQTAANQAVDTSVLTTTAA